MIFIIPELLGEITFDISDPNDVDTVELRINDNGWREFNGDTVVSGCSWTFRFNESGLDELHSIKLFANDSLGYERIIDDLSVFFDNTQLGFFPDLLPNGYLFNGSNFMVIQNSTSNLLNKTIKVLHIYTNSEYTDLGYYYNLEIDFNHLIIDSAKISDGYHTIYFDFEVHSGNHFIFDYPIYVDNIAPEIVSITINNKSLGEEVFFNDHTDLEISLTDTSEISSVTLKVIKILGDPAIYELNENEKVWSSLTIRRSTAHPNNTYYLTPEILTYSFHDGWQEGSEFVYENVLYWNNNATKIPFANLSIYSIEEAYSYNGASIPFFYDNIRQEITFDERYRHYLTEDIILKGVKCDLGWNSSFSINGDLWELTNFDVVEYVTENSEEWYENLFGFVNDDSKYHVHYDHPQKYTRDRFEFYLEIKDEFGNIISTQIYRARYDNIAAVGSFGQIIGSTTNGAKYWILGETADAGNIMFGTSNKDYHTLFFTPGYVYNSSSDSYYVKNEFLFLHNIERIRLFNASNYYLGEMIFDPTITPHPCYTFELDSKDFAEGITSVKAEIYDQADNNYTILQNIFVMVEGPNELQNALDFGDIIYHSRDVNYTENPIQFNGLLDNWASHGSKSNITVEMGYYDFVEQVWVLMGTSTTSDGAFTIDWHVDNNTYYKLLSYQRGYIPINFTYNERPSNYFYGSYGYFDDTNILHPFLVDLGGNMYVYSYNESNHQWFINYTIDLGFSLVGKVIRNFDLNKDNRTDLVIFNQLSDSDTISFYLFNENTLSFDFNQTILASDINLPQTISNHVFKEYVLDFKSTEFLSMYVCVSNSSNMVNYIAKLDFDNFLSKSQDNDATPLPGARIITALNIIGDNVYVGATNPAYQGRYDSSIFSLDKELIADSLIWFENATRGAIIELNSYTSSLGEVVVAGLSMNSYNEDDIVLYYIYDASTETWYKTIFSLDSEMESFTDEVYDFRIRELVYCKEGSMESMLISSTHGLWKTLISTDIITLISTPFFYAVDTFRKWDLFEYGQDNTALIPLTHYPAIEVLNVYEFDRYYDVGIYTYDALNKIDTSGYYISADRQHLVCRKNAFNWRAKTEDIKDSDIYYEVRYFYEATMGVASGLLSSNYKKEEKTHVGSVKASNSQMKADRLGFQLLNPDDPNHWTFYYGTSSITGYEDWNSQYTEITSGVPYLISQGSFGSSGITSADVFSSLTEFDNLRMNYGTINTIGQEVFTSAELSQFETGQDFNRPNDFQPLYDNTYYEMWAEDLDYSYSMDFTSDMADYTNLLNTMDNTYSHNFPNTEGTVAYKPDIINVDIKNEYYEEIPSEQITFGGADLIDTLTAQDYLLSVYEENPNNDIFVDVTFQLDDNEDFESIEYILVSTAFAHEIHPESGYGLTNFRTEENDNNINIRLLNSGNTPLAYFKDKDLNQNFQATNLIASNGNKILKTMNFGDSIYSDSAYTNQSYYKVSNVPSEANFLHPIPYSIQSGVFMKKSNNVFEFYSDSDLWSIEEHHIYDYNYLRLDTRYYDSISDTFVSDGEMTLRVTLKGYPDDPSKMDYNKLILRQLNCIVFSNKDNLVNKQWTVSGNGYTKKVDNGGLILDSGKITLNDTYPTKDYVDTYPDSKYRAVFRVKDTSQKIQFWIGNSSLYEFNPNNLNIDSLLKNSYKNINSFEFTYDSIDDWQLFVNGINITDNTHSIEGLFDPASFDPSGTTISDLYPKIGIEYGYQIEIREIKNQIFKKIDYTDRNSWAQLSEFSNTEDLPNVGGAGETGRDLTYSDVSLNREILVNFNDGITDINNALEDLRLWSDLDFSTNKASVPQGYYDPNFPIFEWSQQNKAEDIDYIALDVSYDGSRYDVPDMSGYSDADLISPYTENAWLGLKKSSSPSFAPYILCSSFSPQSEMPENIYISDIEINFKVRCKALWSINDANLRIEIISNGRSVANYPFSLNEDYEEHYEEHREQLNDVSVFTYLQGGYGRDKKEAINDAFTYTDNFQISELNMYLEVLDRYIGYPRDLEIDVFHIIFSTTNEPITFYDNLHEQEFEIPYNDNTGLYILDKDSNKKWLTETSNFDSVGSDDTGSIEKLLAGTSDFDFNDIIFKNSFGANSLSFNMKSNIYYPDFADTSATISATNAINEFTIVPKLTTEGVNDATTTEGKGLKDTIYPYRTSWWNQQEFATALPFNITFPGITEANVESLSDIIFKVQFNTNVYNFSEWSWRPNLKVFQKGTGDWFPYLADASAYHDVTDKIIWNYENDYIPKYDRIQTYHDPIKYFNKTASETTDNCTIVFKLSRDKYNEKYDFKEIVQFSGGDAYITVLGLIYVIPGKYNGQWDLTYEENFVDQGRMNISTKLTYIHSYARTFQVSNIIKKNINLSPEYESPQSLITPWINLSGLSYVQDIATVENVFGITENPKMVSVLVDPTPETPIGNDFWRFNRTEERLYLPNWAILRYDKFNFTSQVWSDMVQNQTYSNRYHPDSSWQNVTMIENVIGVRADSSIEYFTKNFESDYTFMTKEPYFITLYEDNSINYIEFGSGFNPNDYTSIRAVVHYTNNSDNEGYQERTQLKLHNTLKFPFAIANPDEERFLDVLLLISFKTGFRNCHEAITNIRRFESDYTIKLDFFKRETGTDTKLGTLTLEDLGVEVFSRYDTYNLVIDLKQSGMHL
ncbi:hypothetical protein ES703_04633 [subsurface metagenome]